METLYENIASLCSDKKISINKMCRDLGMRNSVISDLKTGRKKGLSADTLSKIASYFGVTLDYLLGSEQKEKPTSAQADELDREFSELLRKLTPDQLELVKAQIKGILSNY